MARLARVIAVGVPHHITQRGDAQRFILEGGADRKVYLDLLRQSMELYEIELIGYCLMSNHIHLVAIPRKPDILAAALKDTHGRFASYWNAIHYSAGQVWQGRNYFCPLEKSDLWEALRYTELNPVRASLVARAERWECSSAAAHCGAAMPDAWLAMDLRRSRWCAGTWRAYLDAGASKFAVVAIRHSTHSGRPLGSADFTRALERETKRYLAPRKRGPKLRPKPGERRGTLSFGA
jgi:putative transposase